MAAPLDWRQAVGSEADESSETLRRIAVETICARLEEGESLRAICSGPGMPALRTFLRWVEADEAFRHQYARARERQADALAEEIISIVDAPGDPQDKRVRMDARKWFAGKLRPKVYGDRVTQEHTGEGGGPVRVRVEVVDVGSEAPAEGSAAASPLGDPE